jgi:hypothetical protein
LRNDIPGGEVSTILIRVLAAALTSMFWFAQNKKHFRWVEKNYLLNGDAKSPRQNRLLPAVMLCE